MRIWWQARVAAIRDRVRVWLQLDVLMRVLEAQNAASLDQKDRIEKLEQLAIQQSRILKAQHEVLQRWASESATLRGIEESHANRARREHMKLLKAAEDARAATVRDGADGREEASQS